MDIIKALKYVELELQVKRYEHTVRVLEQAEKLAIIHNININNVRLAAIFHDYAKNRPLDEQKRIILSSSLPKDLLVYHNELWHGPVASIIIKEKFGITNTEVLEAVQYHTTGRAYMSDLEMLVSLADYTEANRNFAGLEHVRKMAEKNLVEAAFLMTQNTIKYLMAKGSAIYPDTFNAYNYLAKKVKNKNDKNNKND